MLLIALLAVAMGAHAESVNLTLKEGEGLEEALDALTCQRESITSLNLTGTLDSDDMDCFQELTHLVSLDLRKARFDTFSGCGGLTCLQTVWLPSCMKECSMPFFFCTALKDVYCYSVLPHTQEMFTGVYNPCTLHVPAVSIEAYRQKISDEWMDETVTVTALDEPLTDACIFRYFTLDNVEGWQDVNVELSSLQSWGDNLTAGALTVDVPDATWHIGKITLPIHFWDYYESFDDEWNPTGRFYNRSGSLLCRSSVEASQVEVEIYDDPYFGEWTFFSLPFDVRMSDITSNSNAPYVIRRYAGENRASLTGNTWVNVGKDEMLKAGQGYILKRDRSELGSRWEDETEYYFRLPAADNANKQNLFRTGDVVLPITPFPAPMTHNSGWNLMGNPYPCYYRISRIAEQAVILQYDDSNCTYIAYSTLDDSLVLRPFDAFFIQYSADVPQLTFRADGRIAQMKYGKEFYGKEEDEDEDWDDDDEDWGNEDDDDEGLYEAKAMRQFGSERTLFNILLSDGDHRDRVRLVINPEASLDYELQRDAVKMVATGGKASQIYFCENGLRCAIDERPEDDGLFAIGIMVAQGGRHTIHLQTDAKAISLWLIDRQTGGCVDLTKEDYVFDAVTGSDDSRFYLSVHDPLTGIRNALERAGDGRCYDLTGRPLTKGTERGIVVSREKKTLLKNL